MIFRCTECGTKVSEKAEKCPKCGSLTKEQSENKNDLNINKLLSFGDSVFRFFVVYTILAAIGVLIQAFVISSVDGGSALLLIIIFAFVAIALIALGSFIRELIKNKAHTLEVLCNIDHKLSYFWNEANIDMKEEICQECGFGFKKSRKACPNCGNPMFSPIREDQETIVKEEKVTKDEDDW